MFRIIMVFQIIYGCMYKTPGRNVSIHVTKSGCLYASVTSGHCTHIRTCTSFYEITCTYLRCHTIVE